MSITPIQVTRTQAPHNFRPLSPLSVALVQAMSILRSAARAIVKRIRRDRDVVMDEYDQGYWAMRREHRAWERASSLEEFLVGTDQQPIFAKIDGTPARVALDDYYRYRFGALARLVREKLPLGDELIEVGCGFGYNLFSLSLAFPERRFVGLDISANGIEMGRAIAAHFGLSDRICFDFLDVTQVGAANFRLLEGRSCFTFFCLEQLPDGIEKAMTNLAAARPHRVLHVESSAEHLDLRRPGDWANYAFVRSMDYQNSLLRVLRRLDGAGAVRLLQIGRVPFAPTLWNDGFIAAWEPAERR